MEDIFTEIKRIKREWEEKGKGKEKERERERHWREQWNPLKWIKNRNVAVWQEVTTLEWNYRQIVQIEKKNIKFINYYFLLQFSFFLLYFEKRLYKEIKVAD